MSEEKRVEESEPQKSGESVSPLDAWGEGVPRLGVGVEVVSRGDVSGGRRLPSDKARTTWVSNEGNIMSLPSEKIERVISLISEATEELKGLLEEKDEEQR